MKRIIIVTIMAMVVLLAIGQVSAAEFKATMKMGSTQPSDHPYMVGAQKFADLIKQRTNGRIVINLYPSSQLGKGEREMVESMKQGTIELVVSSTGPLGGFSPSINILDIPYLFRDYAHVDAVLDGPIGRQLLNDMDKHGIVGMAFWENGFRHLTNSKVATKNVEQAKGLKIRVMENKVHLLAWKTAGLNPTPMAWGELYPALQQGVIDGQENPVAVFYSAKFWEVQKYFAMTYHVYSPAPFMMSKKKFQAMPKADQDLFMKTALEVAVFQRKLNRDDEEAKLKEMAGKGLVVIRDVDKASFAKAMQPAYAEWNKDFGKDKIEAIVNTKAPAAKAPAQKAVPKKK
jgi:tripartite ATP-independent transporter DctP family solute receptor